MRAATLLAVAMSFCQAASGQVVSQRGFVEARATVFPQQAPNDPTRAVADVVIRDEVFVKPAPWLRLAVGADLRGNSHDQIEDGWRIDFADRGVRRPRVSVRRATATISRGAFTLDVGKQFIRWGKADIVNPTDRFAPRDFLNVLDADFIAVTGARGVAQAGEHDTLEAVWVPRFTPSRMPLVDQRWTAFPGDLAAVHISDGGGALPTGAQTGVRWSRVGTRIEYSLSFFNGYNHLPDIVSHIQPAIMPVPDVRIEKVYPAIRMYGADLSMPSRWFTVKGEVAYFTSGSAASDEYALYVIQLERQTGEWVLVGGYAGEVVTDRRAPLTFAPDRGMTKAAIGRASYTIDPSRSVAIETAIRQDLGGSYGRAEYSQAYGGHWRATVAGVVIRGASDDFLGQYRRNSHASLVLRYSF